MRYTTMARNDNEKRQAYTREDEQLPDILDDLAVALYMQKTIQDKFNHRVNCLRDMKITKDLLDSWWLWYLYHI